MYKGKITIISNTAMSLDGKISTAENRHIPLGSAHDRRHMADLRLWADALLVGGNTFRHYPDPFSDSPALLKKRPHALLYVVMTRKGVSLPEDIGHGGRLKPLVCAGNPGDVCEILDEKGITKLLIEAGGDILFQFIEAELLDEMYITLCPKIIGGATSPSLVSGKGFPESAMKSLKLINHQKSGDELFLHYRFNR